MSVRHLDDAGVKRLACSVLIDGIKEAKTGRKSAIYGNYTLFCGLADVDYDLFMGKLKSFYWAKQAAKRKECESSEKKSKTH